MDKSVIHNIVVFTYRIEVHYRQEIKSVFGTANRSNEAERDSGLLWFTDGIDMNRIGWRGILEDDTCRTWSRPDRGTFKSIRVTLVMSDSVFRPT